MKYEIKYKPSYSMLVVDLESGPAFGWAMPAAPTVFAQITTGIFPAEFARCTRLYPMPRCSRSFSAYDHFLALCFGHLTGRESLRDVVTCLAARPQLQYRLGFRGRISRTNFAYANEHRNWRVFAALAQLLMRKASRLYRDDPAAQGLPELVYALDASIIHLSLKLFPWAYYPRSRASALKLHTLLALRGSLPVWAAITEASFAEQKMLDEVPIEPGRGLSCVTSAMSACAWWPPARWIRAAACVAISPSNWAPAGRANATRSACAECAPGMSWSNAPWCS